jgi:CHASE2 domain-containing sensor protein
MADSKPDHAGRIPAVICAARRIFLITVGWLNPPEAEAIRAATLACLFAIAFAASGIAKPPALAGFLANSPFDLDWALRTVSAGWFRSDRELPVTLVDIDDATYQGWGSPALTPRGELARMIDAVAAANPAAVVVDIDFSGGGPEADGRVDQPLIDYFAGYRHGAPIILPKRIEAATDGTLHITRSPLDGVVESIPALWWAHASFETDGDGAVRQWARWLAVCSHGGPQWLPAIPVRVAMLLDPLPRDLDRPRVPDPPASCQQAEERPRQRLIIGPRLTGESGSALEAGARAISASLLLDAELARDDAQLFGGRIVIIGASHAGTSDFWLTPSGVLPGVELLANAIRYSTLRAATGPGAELVYRIAALGLFAMFALQAFWLRGVAALLCSIIGGLTVVALAVGIWNYFGIFEALEAAILLTLFYATFNALLKTFAECRAGVLDIPSGPGSVSGVLRVVFFKRKSTGGGSAHEAVAGQAD